MVNSKRDRILDAATKVFAENGYQYATISDIAKEAQISTGLMYSYFTNKLDLLLSIIVSFVHKVNQLNQASITDEMPPLEKLQAVLHNFEELLIKDEKALYMVKVSNEALPHMVMIKDKVLQEKRYEIVRQFNELLDMIDGIIEEGQGTGVFDASLKPSLVRQTLLGAMERIVHGLFVTTITGTEIGYTADDAHDALARMVETFICK